MIEISINLPEDVVKYMDQDPYIGDHGKFIAMLIRRWQRDLEKSRREAETYKNNPDTIILESACLDAILNTEIMTLQELKNHS